MSDFKLSVTGKVLVAMSLATMGSTAFAANIEAVNGAVVDVKNGVDVVDIVAPNAQGLSHNQYNQYNVSNKGAVLNNAVAAGKSQLAGDLQANRNFNNQAASVILNEVVSKNPSLILGKQEIFGMSADYVLANPNGITHNGGSIINANRASLVVGTPEIVDGRLDQLNTATAGSNALTVNGNLDGTAVLDLVAPKVIVNAKGKVSSTEATNIVSGSNKVGYTSGSVVKQAQAAKAAVLDGKVYGSINSGSIRVHSTDENGTQELKGATLTASKDLLVNVAGNLNINTAQLKGADIGLSAKNTTIDGTVSKAGEAATGTLSATTAVKTTTATRARVRPGTTTVAKPATTSSAPKMTTTTDGNRVTTTTITSGSEQEFTGTSIVADKALTLKNTGDVNIKGASIKAGTLAVDAANINTSADKTVSTSNNSVNKSKGLWYNNTQTTERNETLHATTINVTGDANLHATNAVNLKATSLTAGGNVTVDADKNINFTGDKATDTKNVGVQFKNETWRLLTGTASQSSSVQNYEATQIKAGGDVVLNATNNLTAAGAKVNAGGNLLVDVDRVKLTTETSVDSGSRSDNRKVWGGLFGGSSGDVSQTDETLNGAALTAGKSVILDSNSGVDIHGSAVKGTQGAFVNAGAGRANITHAVANHQSSSNQRVGTIFNITKEKSSNQSQTQTATGSNLNSDANLIVRADQDINVLGSKVSAAKVVTVESGADINVGAAVLKSQHNNSSFSIKGKSNADANVSKQSVSAGIGLDIIKQSEQSQLTTHSAANITSGQGTTLAAKNDVTIKGSEVGSQGDVAITGQNVSVLAVQDTNNTVADKRVTSIGIGASVAVNNGAPKLTVSAGIDSTKTDTTSQATTAQVSGLTGNNIAIAATNNITQQGTNITATGSVNQSATNINNTAAQNTLNSTTVESKGGVGVAFSIDTNKAMSVSASVHGSGGKTTEAQTQGVAGSVTAGKDVVINATGNATDVGTKYTAGNNVTITADKYENTVVSNTSSKVSNSGGVQATLTASTSDLATVNVNLGVQGNYKHLNSQTEDQTKGEITANNVDIKSNTTANIASNITAKQDITITAQDGVTLTDAVDTEKTVTGGATLGGSVGVKVVPAAGVVVPNSVSVNAGGNYGHNKVSDGQGSELTATNITINGGDKVALQGSNVTATNNVNIAGDQVTSQAASKKVDSVNVGIGVNAKVGLADGGGLSSIGGGIDADVNLAQGTLYDVNTVKGNNVTITGNSDGKGVDLVGTNVVGSNVSVTNADADGTVSMSKVNGLYVSGGLSAGVNANANFEKEIITKTETQTWKDMCGNEYTTTKIIVEEEEKITGGGGGHFKFTPPSVNNPPPSGGEIILVPPTPNTEVPPAPVEPTPPTPAEPTPPTPAEPTPPTPAEPTPPTPAEPTPPTPAEPTPPTPAEPTPPTPAEPTPPTPAEPSNPDEDNIIVVN